MVRIYDYCPMVGKCPHEPVDIIPNSYFLIQPFDSEKEKREKAIEDALRKFYGSNQRYKLIKSDSKIYDFGSYCDIFIKIKSSQFCIVDISGELHETINKVSGKKETKVFLRPNVTLELGMAYGFNKPALILSRKLNNKRQLPSDIEFVRYIDITLINFKGWSSASQKLLDRLRERMPFIPIKESVDLDQMKFKQRIKKYYKTLLHLKKRLPFLQKRNFKINQIVYREGKLVGIIKEAKDLFEDIYFDFYVLENEIEQLVGQLRIYHVQPSGLVQVEFNVVKGGGNYLDEVAKYCFKNDDFIPGEHRLELIIPEELKKITLKEIKELINNIQNIL